MEEFAVMDILDLEDVEMQIQGKYAQLRRHLYRYDNEDDQCWEVRQKEALESFERLRSTCIRQKIRNCEDDAEFEEDYIY
jgi:hypothetical protein